MAALYAFSARAETVYRVQRAPTSWRGKIRLFTNVSRTVVASTKPLSRKSLSWLTTANHVSEVGAGASFLLGEKSHNLRIRGQKSPKHNAVTTCQGEVKLSLGTGKYVPMRMAYLSACDGRSSITASEWNIRLELLLIGISDDYELHVLVVD
jgi:hypothetical protein